MSEEKGSARTWFIRAGEDAVRLDQFLEKSVVSIGFFGELGPAPLELSKKDLEARLKAQFPAWKQGKLQSAANQFARFVGEVQKSDPVVTYDPGQRRYILGTVEGDVRFSTDDPEHPYQRSVRWTHFTPRDALTAAARNSLGAIQTLFRVPDDVAKELEIRRVPLGAEPAAVPPPAAPTAGKRDVALVDYLASVPKKADELIEDRLVGLDWEEMQVLVAGILRAMGYKPRVSPKGGDRGFDIFASPDGLGLQAPRIFAEVKHRPQTAMSAPEIRSFLGGRKAEDRCLYVSTGGFSKEARYEADRAMTPVMLIDLPELRRLFLEYYERLDEECRALVPLTRVYWPTAFDAS